MSKNKEPEVEPTAPEPNSPEATAPPPPRRIWPVLLVLLVLLLAAAGGGAGWYFDQQLRTQAVLQQDLAQDVRQQLGEMAGRVSVLNQALESRLEGIACLENRVDDLRDAISQEVESQTTDWAEAEAAWLARIAIYRVRFNADYAGALEALKVADALLAARGGAGIDGRAAIAEAVDRLLQAERAETPLINQGLTALAQRLDALPLAQDIQAEPAGAAAMSESDPPGDFRERAERAWERLVDGLEGLVVVSRDRTVVPLPEPETRFLLQQNLQLKVESARLAALMSEPEIYAASLEQVDAWVAAYFDTLAPEVVEVRERIADLQTRTLVVEPPDIATPLQRLVNEVGAD